MDCPFCRYITEDPPDYLVLWENDFAFAIKDRYPVSPGHTLIIPKRHVADFFDCSPSEQLALLEGSRSVKKQLTNRSVRQDGKLPTGWNLGINVGKPAGQTVFHVHLHLIPRYSGDVDEPAGGVRSVIPNKQKYQG
jgi:diadenosine tetraphosphate (Ap4A) HIT family hydrolase